MPAEDVFQRVVGEVSVSLGSIEVLRHAETLALCVSFVVRSRIGEHTIRISVQDQSSLNHAANDAQEMLRYWAAGIHSAAAEPLFQTAQGQTTAGDGSASI